MSRATAEHNLLFGTLALQTAFVTRPLEYGPAGKPDLKPDASVDLSARDFNDLATQLGA